ncbi:hypothetical protein [Nonomuraea sp. NPDC002799]
MTVYAEGRRMELLEILECSPPLNRWTPSSLGLQGRSEPGQGRRMVGQGLADHLAALVRQHDLHAPPVGRVQPPLDQHGEHGTPALVDDRVR